MNDEGTAGGAVTSTAEMDTLRQEYAKLEHKYVTLEERERELAERVSHLLSELADHRRDRARTYVADTPQAHLIADAWKLLGGQGFRAIGRKLLPLAVPGVSGKERRPALARIRAELSREILMHDFRRLRAVKERLELKDFLDRLHELPLPAARRAAVAAVVEPMLVAAAPQAVGVADVLDHLGIDPDAHGKALGPDIEALLAKAGELVAKVLSTDPPGELWVDEDVAFDPERHQAELGSAEEGMVRSTSHPGYRLGDRVICKALVATASCLRPAPRTPDEI
jgi:hypothetical protein